MGCKGEWRGIGQMLEVMVASSNLLKALHGINAH